MRVTHAMRNDAMDTIELLLGEIETIATLTAKIAQLDTKRHTLAELAEKMIGDDMYSYADSLYCQAEHISNEIDSLVTTVERKLDRVEGKYNQGYSFDINFDLVTETLHCELSDSLDAIAQVVNSLYSLEDISRVA